MLLKVIDLVRIIAVAKNKDPRFRATLRYAVLVAHAYSDGHDDHVSEKF